MPELHRGDVYRIPGDKPGRLWVVETVTPSGAMVRPYTKKLVTYETADGDEVTFEASDGKRTVISAHSDVEIVERDVEIRLPSWLRK